MRIEALEDIKSGPYVVTAGDSITVPDELGAQWCARGWAKDTIGTVPTGERRVLDARLVMGGATHGQASEKVGG